MPAWHKIINATNFAQKQGQIKIYVLLPYIVYVMQSRHFSQYPAFLSRTAKERDKKYIVKSL
jgi:hypothetical protein